MNNEADIGSFPRPDYEPVEMRRVLTRVELSKRLSNVFNELLDIQDAVFDMPDDDLVYGLSIDRFLGRMDGVIDGLDDLIAGIEEVNAEDEVS